MASSIRYESRVGFVPVAISRMAPSSRRHVISESTFARTFLPVISVEVIESSLLECIVAPDGAAFLTIYMLPSSSGGGVLYAPDGTKSIILPGGLIHRAAPLTPLGLGPIERDEPYRVIVVAFADGVTSHIAEHVGDGINATDPSMVPCVVSGGTSARVIAGGGTFCRSVLPDDLGLLVVDIRMAPRSAALVPLQSGLTRVLAVRLEGVVDIEGANSSSQSVALMECCTEAKSLSFRTAQEGARVIIIGTLYSAKAPHAVAAPKASSQDIPDQKRKRRWDQSIERLLP